LFCGWSHPSTCTCSVCLHLMRIVVYGRRKRGRKKKKNTQPLLGEKPMKKPSLDLKGQQIVPLQRSDFCDSHPNLWEYLTSDAYDCGTPRKTATLLIFLDYGTLKACLSDRETSRTAFVTAGNIESLLANIEKGLSEDNLDWRVKQEKFNSAQRPPY